MSLLEALQEVLLDVNPVDLRFSYYTPRVLRIHDSALKHGYTREDISHAYDMYLYEGPLPEDTDPPKLLVIGPDHAANLLELIGGEFENGEVWIWHAMRCRAAYLSLLPGRGGGR